ncbi:unnamed protein product, partial [Mesorhabditis spiculigera]
MRSFLALLFLLVTIANCEARNPYWTCKVDADCLAGRSCRKSYHNFPLKSCLRPREYRSMPQHSDEGLRCATDDECPAGYSCRTSSCRRRPVALTE